MSNHSKSISAVERLPEIVRFGLLTVQDEVKRDLQERFPNATDWNDVPITLAEFFDLQAAKVSEDMYQEIHDATGLPLPTMDEVISQLLGGK